MTIRALMVDVDGVLVRGRRDGGRWSSSIEADLGVTEVDLKQAFFSPHWDDIVTGRRGMVEVLRPVLQRIAPHLSHHDLIDYWFAHDGKLDHALIAGLDRQRERGTKIYLATNQEHLRATYLLEELGLGQHCDGIYYSAALGCRKPDRLFFEKTAVLSHIPAGELLLLDDLAENVIAARTAGWRALQWLPDSSLPEDLQRYCD